MHFQMTSAGHGDAAVPTSDGYKAMVCLLLRDGIDSFNVLAPFGTAQNDAHYAEYLSVRGPAAMRRRGLWDGAYNGPNYGYMHSVVDSASPVAVDASSACILD